MTLIGELIGLVVVILAAIDLIRSYAKHSPVAPFKARGRKLNGFPERDLGNPPTGNAEYHTRK
jgi:hypothetical protein